MGAPRFFTTATVALGVHAGLALALAIVPPPPRERRAWPAPVGETDVTAEPAIPPAASEVKAAVPAMAPAAPQHALPGHYALPSTAESSASAPLVPHPASSSAPSPSPATPTSRPVPSSVNLGLGDYWKKVALDGSGGAGAPPVDSSGASLDEGMRAEVHEHDRTLGLGADGPIVSAAHEAASPAIAPDTGDAVFDVECDAYGGNVTARVVSAGGSLGEWNAVAREIVRQMSARRMHVPNGARGLRTRIQIVAERTLPAGNRLPPPTPGAVPDDVPGTEKSCVGSGWQRKCTKGSAGVTTTVGDVSNIAARLTRIVRVHVLGETKL